MDLEGILRVFLPQPPSLSSFGFVCQGRPHTGTAVAGSQSYFLRSCCQVNRHVAAHARTHARRQRSFKQASLEIRRTLHLLMLT